MTVWILMLVIFTLIILILLYAIITFYELTVEDVVDIAADETKEVVRNVQNATSRVIRGVI